MCIYVFSILRKASGRRPWAKQVYNLVAREAQSREPRLVLARCKIRCAINKSFYEYMLGVRQWRHVALRHGAFCVFRQHRLCRWWPAHFHVLFRKGSSVYSPMKECLQSVNHKQFPIQMTQNNKHNKWQEILDFQPKLLWRTPTKIHRERRRRSTTRRSRAQSTENIT